ncbi:hypothetical protein N2152v2_001707 [Parachlorella kessleri]
MTAIELGSGTRNFTCGSGGQIAVSQAIANVTGDYEGLLIYNPTGIPIFELYNASTGEHLGAVWLEMRRPAPTMVPASTPDTLALARWQIMRITGSLPIVGFVTRTNTTGGKAPAPCEPAGALLAVPYTATYTFYACQ